MKTIKTKILCLFLILTLLVIVSIVASKMKLIEKFQVYRQDIPNSDMVYEIHGQAPSELAIDPIDPNKSMRVQRLNQNSEIMIGRKSEDIYKDFSVGFYFKLSNPNITNNYIFSTKDMSDNENLNISMDAENLTISFEGNEQIIPIDQNFQEEYSYIFLKGDLQTDDFIPRLIIIYNNNKYEMVLNNKEAERVNVRKFIFGNNSRSSTGFSGFIGKIKVFNEIISREVMCRYYNCNLSCFVPDGSKTYNGDPNECIKDCFSQCGDINICQKICINCEVDGTFWDKEEKLRRCPWLSEIKVLDATIPEAPKIRGFAGDKKILIEWKKPFNGRSEISNYIILYYESFNKQSGANINISSKSNNDILEYQIENLKNKTYYDIEVRAVNNKGIGPPSNIVSIAPNGSVLTNTNQNIFNELGGELQKEVDNTRMDFMCNINNFDSIGHTLDYYEDDMKDIKGYIKKLQSNT